MRDNPFAPPDNQCKWIEGYGRSMKYTCSEQAMPKSSYCEEHHKRTHTKEMPNAKT